MSGSPTWVAGQVPAAGDFDSWFQPLTGVKTADQITTSNTTLINDADMRVALQANSIYEFHCFIRYGTDTTPDLKVSVQVPSGADCRYMVIGNSAAAFGSFVENPASQNVELDGAGAGTFRAAYMLGVVFTAGTSGNLIFQWAQQTSTATNTTLRQYSYISAQRIA